FFKPRFFQMSQSSKHTVLLQFVNWAQNFERPESCFFDIEDSSRLLSIMGERDGAAIYGILVLVIDRCRRQPAQRDGWLTQNGSRDGERYSVEYLAGLFHRPQAEIMRSIQVATSMGVNLMRFVEGDFAMLMRE